MSSFFRFIKLFMLPQWRLFTLALLTGLIAAGASGLGLPLMVYTVFPIIFTGVEAAHESMQPIIADWQRSTILLLACICLPLVFVVRGLAMWLNAVVVNMLALRILEHIRLSVFVRLLELPLAFLDKQRKGDLLSRIVSDTQNVQLVISHTSNDLVKQPITCLSALSAFFYLIIQNGASWLFVVSLLAVLLAVYPIIVFGRRIAKQSHQAQDDLGEMNTILQQNLETQRDVRAYAMEAQQVSDFSRVTEVYSRAIVKVAKYRQALIPMMEVITALTLSFLLVQGKLSGMTLSDFLAIAAALFMAFDSMKRTGRAYNRINEAQGALTRLTEILDEPNTMPNPSSPKQWESPVTGALSLKQVSFSYDRSEGKGALRRVQVEIPAGQIVGLVGPSGAGKTTFASLIPRFYDVSLGQIRLDGIDIRDVRQSDLREHIALVGQHALLFTGTIRENIAFGKPQASEDEIIEAARAAALGELLAKSPQGLDTLVGEGGQSLSGGERQRIAIARAFIKDAPVLILDEATASLDAKSEREIQRSLEQLIQGRTTLIIAHRFSTLRHVHRLLVFDQGEIVGDGTHEQLYESCELYRELYDKQGMGESHLPTP